MEHDISPTEPPELVRLYDRRQACVDRIGRLARAAAILHREQDHTLNQLLDINAAIRGYDGNET